MSRLRVGSGGEAETEGEGEGGESSFQEFRKLLHDVSGLRLFEEFCKKKFAEENLDFWMDIERYKSFEMAGFSKRLKLAQEIYSNYRDKVNLDECVWNPILKQISDENAGSKLFLEAQKQLQHILFTNFFGDFQKTESYKTLKRKEGRSRAFTSVESLQRSINCSSILPPNSCKSKPRNRATISGLPFLRKFSSGGESNKRRAQRSLTMG